MQTARLKFGTTSLFRVEKPEQVCLSISPDKFVKNDKTLILVTSLYDTYTAPIHRIKFRRGIEYKKKHVPIWEIIMDEEKIKFNLYTDMDFLNYVKGKLATTWPDAAVSITEERETFDESKTQCAYMQLMEHHMLSLDTNQKTENNFVESVLNVHGLLKDGDRAVLQIVLDPASDEWQQECDNLFEEYKNTGYLPVKLLVDPKRTFKKSVETVLDFTVQSIEGFIDSLASSDRMYATKKKSVRQLSQSTLFKTTNHAFWTQIRIGCESSDKSRAKHILKSIANSFRELDGDNKLIMTLPRDNKRMVKCINERSNEWGKEQKCLLSVKEVNKMIALPSPDLQKMHPAVQSLQYRETDIPDDLVRSGIVIGEVTRKGKRQKIYYPTDNLDMLCLPRVVIGQMGSGKSSYASTFARSAFYDNNFNVIAIDVADGRMCNQIRDSIPPDRKNDIVELDFGQLSHPIGLVWNEALDSMNNSGNRLTAELLSFMEKITGQFGPQMRRWMKKAAQAVYEDKNSTILDVILMLVDEEYRVRKIPTIKNVAVKQAWMQFQTFNERQQQLIVSPVLNRLDYLLDDDNMKNILCQIPRKDAKGNFMLDFRKLINQDLKSDYRSKCILIKVPVAELGEAATDAIVAFIISKIWLTVQTRDRNRVIEHGVPTFLLMDEPHQFMSSVENWKRMVVESRKWRLGLVWFFHTWEQIRDKSKELAKTIKSAGIHYILYNSSKDTWKELQEEIAPYTIAEALELPRYHAFVITHTKEGPVPPMLVKIEPPVDMLYPKYDNSDIAEKCLKIYSRPIREVEYEITKKELSLLGIDPTRIADDIPIIDDGKIVKGATMNVASRREDDEP